MLQAIEAEKVETKKEAELYILLCRYGKDFWAAWGTYTNREAAEQILMNTPPAAGTTAWRLVRVAGLPLDLPAGEV